MDVLEGAVLVGAATFVFLGEVGVDLLLLLLELHEQLVRLTAEEHHIARR